MNWRWIIPAALALAAVEALAGLAAYSSMTWNLRHTEVLTGWAAVREVCLVFMPLTVGILAVGSGLVALAVRWAWRGRR
jgi:hypothetical protein